MELKEILKKLVSFNTIRDKENKELMDFIEGYLKQYNFSVERIDKCLIARNSDSSNFGFIGHTDTVDYESWDGDPFTVREEDGKLIGLGTCDMKGGIAAILSAVSKMNLEKQKIALYFTNDEETSFEGIKNICELIKEPNILIGEPTDNIPVYGTKGLLGLNISFYGKKVHSSIPEKGINAIYECMDFVTKLRIFYEENLMKDVDNDFKVPYTSMNIGMITGGETENSVPGKCSITIDFRINKDDAIDKIIVFVEELLKNYRAELIIKNKVRPKLNNSDIKFLEEISSDKETANYFTEASFIESTNIIILGPGPVTAHEKNEYITNESLEECENLYINLINHYNE